MKTAFAIMTDMNTFETLPRSSLFMEISRSSQFAGMDQRAASRCGEKEHEHSEHPRTDLSQTDARTMHGTQASRMGAEPAGSPADTSEC